MRSDGQACMLKRQFRHRISCIRHSMYHNCLIGKSRGFKVGCCVGGVVAWANKWSLRSESLPGRAYARHSNDVTNSSRATGKIL